jgi:hypothetical protein
MYVFGVNILLKLKIGKNTEKNEAENSGEYERTKLTS